MEKVKKIQNVQITSKLNISSGSTSIIQAEEADSKFLSSNLTILDGNLLQMASISSNKAEGPLSRPAVSKSTILDRKLLKPSSSSVQPNPAEGPLSRPAVSKSTILDRKLLKPSSSSIQPNPAEGPLSRPVVSKSMILDRNSMKPSSSSIHSNPAEGPLSRPVVSKSMILDRNSMKPSSSSIHSNPAEGPRLNLVDRKSTILDRKLLKPSSSSVQPNPAEGPLSRPVVSKSMILDRNSMKPSSSSIHSNPAEGPRLNLVDRKSTILDRKLLKPSSSPISSIRTEAHSKYADLQAMLREHELSKPTASFIRPIKIMKEIATTSFKRPIDDSTKESPQKIMRLANLTTTTRSTNSVNKTFPSNKEVLSNSVLVLPTAKAENCRSTDGFSTAVNEVQFTSDDFPTVEFEKSKETDVVNEKEISEISRGVILDNCNETVMRSKTSSFIEQRKDLIDSSSTLKNGYLQTSSIVRRLNAALDANQNLSVKLALLSEKSKADEKKIQELIDKKKVSDDKVVSLETKLNACELIIAALRKDILEKQQLVRQLLKKKDYTVPYQNLQKYRREARLETLVNSVEEIRGLQSDDSSEQAADRMIFNDLFQKLQIESPIVCRTIDPEDDFRTFLSNGVTWTQRELIRKELDELGFNILVSNSRLFRWKKEFSASYENFYRTDLVKVDDDSIPIIQVKDVKLLLEKILQKLKSENKLSSHPNFGGKIWVSVVIDKGSDFTKIILLISNSQKPNSMKDGLILGVYKGDEDHETLRVCLKDMADQINELKTVTVDSVVYDVETHITGDMKTMVALAGIQSCSSTYFCIFCHYFKTKAKDCFFGQHGKERTIESLIDNAKKYLLKTIVSEKERLKAAQESFSSVFLPLFLIILMNFVPSALHLFLGIGNYLLKLLEAECIRIDLGNIDIDASGCNNKNDMVKLKTIITTERSFLTTVQKETENEGKILKSLKIMEQTLANPPTQKKSARIAQNCDKCHSKTCYLSNSVLYGQKIPKSDKLNCSLCNHWFHTTCQLYLSTCHIKTVKNNGFICDHCQPPGSSIIQRIDSKLNDNEEEKKKIVEKLNKTNQKLEDFDKIFETGSNSCYIRLQDAIKNCGAWKSAYNQELNGNHLRKLFTESSIGKLFGVLHFPLDKKLMSIKELMSLLQNIQSYSCARFLEEDEIDDLEMSTKTFIDVFSINFPDAGVFPKLHWLGSHLLPFVRRKKTWGLLSEQPIEHFHAEWNKAQTRFSHITDIQEKLKKIVAFLNCKHFV